MVRVRTCCAGFLEIQLWGACSNPEVVVELRRLVKTAEAVARDRADPQLAPLPAAKPRPGWVYGLVIAVLEAADQPLRPVEVIHRAQRLHGYSVSPSSIRNCLRKSASVPDGAVVRLGYGRYAVRHIRLS